MKIIILGFALGFLLNYSFAQKLAEKDVPPLIKSTFAKIYPAIKKVKWEKEEAKAL